MAVGHQSSQDTGLQWAAGDSVNKGGLSLTAPTYCLFLVRHYFRSQLAYTATCIYVRADWKELSNPMNSLSGSGS